MPKATLAETVAVSLGIDPSATKPGSGYVEPGKEYDRRLKIACAYVSHAGPLKSLDTLPPMHLLYGPASATVSLPQFAEWALSMGWTLPDKFPRWKAAPVKTANQTPAPVQSPAPPAPVVADGMATNKAGPVDKGWVMKKAALIDKHAQRWPTAKRDFQDASENGLSSAAKSPGHGEWFETSALNWAEQRGKLTSEKQQSPANSVFNLAGTKHTMKD